MPTTKKTQTVENKTAQPCKRKWLTGRMIDKIVSGLITIGQFVLAIKTSKK